MGTKYVFQFLSFKLLNKAKVGTKYSPLDIKLRNFLISTNAIKAYLWNI